MAHLSDQNEGAGATLRASIWSVRVDSGSHAPGAGAPHPSTPVEIRPELGVEPYEEVEMEEVPFKKAREVLREVMEHMVADLVENRDTQPPKDGVTVAFPPEGFRRVYGTTEFNLVADLSLRVVPKEPITEITAAEAGDA